MATRSYWFLSSVRGFAVGWVERGERLDRRRKRGRGWRTVGRGWSPRGRPPIFASPSSSSPRPLRLLSTYLYRVSLSLSFSLSLLSSLSCYFYPLSTYLPTYLPTYLSTYLPTYLPTYPSFLPSALFLRRICTLRFPHASRPSALSPSFSVSLSFFRSPIALPLAAPFLLSASFASLALPCCLPLSI